MQTLKHHIRAVIVLVTLSALAIGDVGYCQDLDSARQFWNQTILLLGESPGSSGAFNQLDSLNDVNPCVNAGLRQVASIVPVVGYQSFKYATATTTYALTSTFLPDGLPQHPLRVWTADKDGNRGQGVILVSARELQWAPGVSTALLAYVSGNRISIIGVTPGDSVHVDGPVAALAFSDGADTTNVYRHVRWPAVYWAAWLLGTARQNPAAAIWKQAYDEAIAAYLTPRKQEEK